MHRVHRESEIPPWRVLKFIFERLKNLKQYFRCIFYVQIYAKLQSFIQSPLTLTKLWHIMQNQLNNFYISQCIYHNTQTSAMNRGLKHTQITGGLQFLTRLTEFSENISWKSLYLMFKKSTTSRNACIQTFAKVCGKSSHICCSALFSSGMVFSQWHSRTFGRPGRWSNLPPFRLRFLKLESLFKV